MSTQTVRLSPEQLEHVHEELRVVDEKRDLYACEECGAELCLPWLTEHRRFRGASEHIPGFEDPAGRLHEEIE